MSSKACHEYEELVYMHSEGVLAPGDARRLERHLTECAACRNVLTELRALEQALREMPREPAPQGFAAAVSRRLASLEPEWRRRDAAWDWLPWPRAARRASAIAFAAACAIVLIAVAYVLLPASVAQSLPADAVAELIEAPRQAAEAAPAALQEAGAFLARATQEYAPAVPRTRIYVFAAALFVANVLLYLTRPNLGRMVASRERYEGEGAPRW